MGSGRNFLVNSLDKWNNKSSINIIRVSEITRVLAGAISRVYSLIAKVKN
jgi:hypothetical protein